MRLTSFIAMSVVGLATFLAVEPAWTSGHEGWPRKVAGGSSGGIQFVGEQICASCHRQQHEQWSGSHHDRAMQSANEDTVRGNFDDARLTHSGRTSRFFISDGRYFVNTEGPDGQLADFEILYTFGVEPLQQYLIALPGGRLQAFSIAWDTERRRWFHLYPEEPAGHGDRLHWTKPSQTWNRMCAECHSTNLFRGYDLTIDSYRTTWHAIDVGCQACHGPGEAHVKWARGAGTTNDPAYVNSGFTVNFKANDSRYQVDACARCHARRHAVSTQFAHGDPLLDHFMPEVLREDLYHADGQILEEVYVYGSFLQSKMYQSGVACTDCHNPHTLKLRQPGNALCLQCHQMQPDARFAGLVAKRYDTAEHHYHPEGSTGAQCVNCHMPAKKYMVVDPRRDHSFRIPRPDLTLRLGTPNACNACHTDQSAQWAVDAVQKWYGHEREQTLHYAEVIAEGRSASVTAPARLADLARDTRSPAIVRATALDLLRRYGRAGATTMTEGLRDSDPLIRVMAVRGLEFVPEDHRLASVAPLLSDPIRAVRSEAARVLASVPPARFGEAQRRAFVAALTEYESTQIAHSDWPSAHLNLAMVQANQGRTAAAEQSYRTAVRLDPDFLPARMNLARLYNSLGRNQDAERTLQQAIERAPDEGELHYSLGLLLAEDGRLEDSVLALGEAARLLPERARVHYNYGLALQQLGRLDGAESALLHSHRLNRTDPSVLEALVALYSQQRKWDRAYRFAERLVRLFPNAPAPRRMLRQIEALRKFGATPP